MKFKIIIAISLFALAFVFSSYVNNKETSRNKYVLIKRIAVFSNTKNIDITGARNCAKCNNCKG